MVKISIVVPIYNVEQYLKQCIESIIGQSFREIEVILVDDGSLDECPKICDEYAEKDNRIKVIHKKNGGLSDARNAGIEIASGEYVLFIDSDDYICEESLKSIYDSCVKQGKPDVFFLQAKKVYRDGTEKKYDDFMDERILNKSKESTFEYLAERKSYPASAWSKLVKLDLIKNNNILFVVGQLSEDYEWTLKLLLRAETFGASNENYYCYRQDRYGSITNNVKLKHFDDLLNIIERFVEVANKNKEYCKCIMSFASFIYRTMLWSAKSYYNEKKDIIKKYQFLLRMKQSKEIKILNLVASMVGLRATIELLSLYRKIRG